MHFVGLCCSPARMLLLIEQIHKPVLKFPYCASTSLSLVLGFVVSIRDKTYDRDTSYSYGFNPCPAGSGYTLPLQTV